MKRKLHVQVTAFLTVLLVASTALAETPACDARCDAIKKLRAHRARQAEFWREAMQAPVESRIGIGGPDLVDYLRLDAIKIGIPDRPRSAQPPKGFVADLKAAFAQIPPQVKAMLTSRLAGIYLVDGIGSTGFSDVIVAPDGRQVGGFIVLDSTALTNRNANTWATWRENTPFKPSPRTTIRATIEPAASDTRTAAIQYILVHELAHVLAVANNIHPPWDVKPEQPKPDAYQYFDLAWSVRDGKYVTRFDADFPQRRDVVYYFGPRIDADDAAAVYARLEHTNFTSLYASTHPADDFAEAFASYVHTQLMGRPFEITIARDGKIAKRFTACWSHPRCADKRRWFDSLFRR